MSDWTTLPLGNLIQLQRGHDLPSPDRIDGSIPIVGSSGITGWHNEAKYEGPGVAIGRSGASIGQATYVQESYWPLNTCLFVSDFKENDPRWVYRLLDSIDFNSFNSGSAQPSLNRNFLRDIPVRTPPLEEQKSIAEILGALDDKIAANTKLAATADEYIRANLADLTADIDDVITIGQLATNRKDLRDPNSLDPNANYVGLEHIPRRSMWLDAAGTADSVTSTKAGFQPGDVLFGKLRPYFHKVVAAPFAGICSTDILVVTSNHDYLADFVLASIASDYVVERVTAASEGTRMPRTSWKDLAAVEVGWPGEEKAREFSASVAAIRCSIESLIRENVHLSATRDSLLPLLMSGQLRVKDAESVVAATV